MGSKSGGSVIAPPKVTENGNDKPTSTETNQNQKEREQFFYGNGDIGPFEVSLESIDKNVGRIHPMDIGKILWKGKIKGVREVQKRGVNRVSIYFDSGSNANDFVNNKMFLKNNMFNAYIPRHMVYSYGLLREVTLKHSEQDILEQLESRINIKGVRCITKKNKTVIDGEEKISYVPTSMVVVTFEGKRLPSHVCLSKVREEVYVYVRPVILCYKCYRYGHASKSCRSATRCVKCGSKEHMREECSASTKCWHCGGDHVVTDRICEEYQRQQKINEVMATDNIDFSEANRRYPKPEQYNEQPNPVPNIKLNKFPLLEQKQTEETLIEPASRNEHLMKTKLDATPKEQTRHSTYSTTVRKRKATPAEEPGYDKMAHNECLFPSTSRIGNTSKTNDWGPTPPENKRRHTQKKDNETLKETIKNKELSEREIVELIKLLVEKSPSLMPFFPSFTQMDSSNEDMAMDQEDCRWC